MEIDGWICLAGSGNSWAKVDVVAGVEEIRLWDGQVEDRGRFSRRRAHVGHDAETLPFPDMVISIISCGLSIDLLHDSGSRTNKVNAGILPATVGGMHLDLLRIWQAFRIFVSMAHRVSQGRLLVSDINLEILHGWVLYCWQLSLKFECA